MAQPHSESGTRRRRHRRRGRRGGKYSPKRSQAREALSGAVNQHTDKKKTHTPIDGMKSSRNLSSRERTAARSALSEDNTRPDMPPQSTPKQHTRAPSSPSHTTTSGAEVSHDAYVSAPSTGNAPAAGAPETPPQTPNISSNVASSQKRNKTTGTQEQEKAIPAAPTPRTKTPLKRPHRKRRSQTPQPQNTSQIPQQKPHQLDGTQQTVPNINNNTETLNQTPEQTNRIRHAPRNPHTTPRTRWEQPDTPKQTEELHSTRTYKYDTASTVREHDESLASIREQERARNAQTPKARRKQSAGGGWKRMAFVVTFVIIALIAGSGVGVGYYYVQTGNLSGISLTLPFFTNNEPQQNTAARDSSASQFTLSFNNKTRDEIISRMRELRSTDIEPQTFNRVNFVQNEEPLSAQTFFETMAPEVPASMIRAFRPAFSAGIYGGTDENHLFIIFQIENHNRARGTLLANEQALLSITPLFTNTDTSEAMVFTDDVIAGKDARIASNSDNTSRLLYTFVTGSALVITDTPEAFRAVAEQYN